MSKVRKSLLLSVSNESNRERYVDHTSFAKAAEAATVAAVAATEAGEAEEDGRVVRVDFKVKTLLK